MTTTNDTPDFAAMFLGAIDMDLAEALLTLDEEGNLVRKPLDFASLTEDGDTLVVDATHRLVLHVEYDPDSSINDYEGDGRTEKYSHETWRERYAPRPSDMDGNARKLWIGTDKGSAGDYIWWQPYDGEMGYELPDGTYASAKWPQLPVEVQRKEVARITELVAWGFKQVGLELQELVDEDYDEWDEVETQWLGGCDSVYPGLVEEQYHELTYRINERTSS